MISSRNNQKFPYKGNGNATLSEIRADLAAQIEEQRLFGEQLFEVWINEPAPAREGSEDLWEACLDEVRKAELVIALYNGDAGWAKASGEIGICHAELKEALNTAPAKVRVLEMEPLAPRRKGDDGRRDDLFREYVESQHLFMGRPCRNGEEIIELCRETLREATAQMVRLGVREARKGKFYSGDALDWSRLDFRARQREMEGVLRRALEDRGGVTAKGDASGVFTPIRGYEVLFVCGAVPAPFSIPEAREGVNQLFLRDHQRAGELGGKRVGPVHLVACHRTITENQALRQLGFPDATVVSPPFGVYVADEVQKVQLVFLANCRDETSTLYQVQRLFDWIEQVGEGPLLVERAAARARIVQAIAREQTGKVKRAGR
ncbi:MAG: hypothetical protein IT165_21730 [Bryobacterales bacterium]|nr:hypothetical protein [Bryobacterales bacterium]